MNRYSAQKQFWKAAKPGGNTDAVLLNKLHVSKVSAAAAVLTWSSITEDKRLLHKSSDTFGSNSLQLRNVKIQRDFCSNSLSMFFCSAAPFIDILWTHYSHFWTTLPSTPSSCCLTVQFKALIRLLGDCNLFCISPEMLIEMTLKLLQTRTEIQ